MTIDQIQYFCAICQYKTFSNAALELHITQSSLSKHMIKLENELDMILFDRSHRQITLTKAGEQFYKDALILLKDYNHMINHLDVLKDNTQNTIRIAMLPILSQYNLVTKLDNFSSLYPSYHVEIDEIEERDIQNILNNQYDMYILRGHIDLPNYKKILLYKDKLTAVTSYKHPLSCYDEVSIIDFKNNEILLPPQYTTIAHIALEEFKTLDFHPTHIRYGRLETILSSLKDYNVAFVMEKTLSMYHLSNLCMHTLHEEVYGNIYLYYLPSRKSCIQNFIAMF
ncbi:MAG: LysR family transcriptional regulator [Erysipelotrichaceae bacterium]|nr:LysR family transcriptional regulator [Erysipelotrichaceae bacterium]